MHLKQMVINFENQIAEIRWLFNYSNKWIFYCWFYTWKKLL